jgi:predicted phosphodiesterase
MGKLSVKGEKAIELIDRFPKAGTHTLARILYKKYPTVYLDFEDARLFIRNHRGEHHGMKSANANKLAERGISKYDIKLPESWSKKKEFFKIPSHYKNIGLMSDIQCPFHDSSAIKAAVDYLKAEGIDCLLLNGDVLDFYALSSFEKDPTKRNFADERIACIELLDWLKNEFPNIPIYYNLDANHEYRYERYMQKKAPEIFSTELFMVEDLLMLHDIGIIPIRGYDHIKVGRLPIVHGHTIFKGAVSPAAPARTVFMKMKHTCVASHCHRVGHYPWTDMKGEVHSTWTTGCLMSLNVEYNQHGNDYIHGFGLIKILNKDGKFTYENKMIVEGSVV